MAARLAMALINVGLTVMACVAWLAEAGKGGHTILAGTIVTGVRVTFINVHLAVCSRVTFCAHTGVGVGPIQALGAIFARCAGTLIHIILTQVPAEAFGALTQELVDLVHAVAIVQTGAAGALVSVDLTVYTLITWHTYTLELPNLVQTSGIILTWVGDTLIDINLTAGPCVSLQTLALKGTQCVEALACMLTGVGTQSTLIHILAAGGSHVARGASADGLAVDRVGVTVGALVAGVADACIIEVAQQTCAPMWTLAVEGSHTVMAGGTLKTGSAGTVIDVLTAVLTSPAIDTHTVVATVGIVAGPTILTGVGHELTLVHILCTVLACPLRWAAAVVGIHAIHTGTPILAVVSWTVIHIFFTVLSSKAWQAGTLVGGVSRRAAGAPVLAG